MPDVTRILMSLGDQDVARALALRLEADGYTVLNVDDAAVGLIIAEEHPPNLIVLDVALPPPEGLALLSQLKRVQATSGIPVLAISDDPGLSRLACVMGAAGHLSKPYTTGALRAMVRKEIAASRAASLGEWASVS